MFVIHANLDAEARWSGSSLPGAIATRVSYYAALLSVLAPDDDVEVWAPAAIDASRLIASPARAGVRAWRPPVMRVGTPPRADLVWARTDAKPANDRRLALAIAGELEGAAGSNDETRGALPSAAVIESVGELEGAAGSNDKTRGALPGTAVIESVDELVAWASRALTASGAAGSRSRWVAKAPWTTAGRDRCHGEGAPTDEQRTRLSRLLDKFGALVVEPWVDRVFDVGLCARIDEFRARSTRDGTRDGTHDVTRRDGTTRNGTTHDGTRDEATTRDATDATQDPHAPDFYVTLSDPHSLITDARGTFLGIDLAAPPLLAHEATQLGVTARTVGAKLAAMGFRGNFAIDAFVYRDATGERRFHSLCEINARTTFGHIARAFEARGFTRLGFSTPPEGATILVAPTNDGVVAWLA